MKRRLTVTFRFTDGKQEIHEADKFTTEAPQYRLDQDTDILLFPAVHVRAVTIKHNEAS